MRFSAFRETFGPFGLRFGWWGPFGFAQGRPFGFGHGRPFGFAGMRPFAHRRRAYVRWLRRYKAELEDELRDVEDELRQLERAEPKSEPEG